MRRRTLLGGAAALALAGSGLIPVGRPAVAQGHAARIAIVGGGAAGLTVANLLSHRLSDAAITLCEPSASHYYQPGFTLVGAGVKTVDYVRLKTADYLPSGIEWVQDSVAEIDPEGRSVTTGSGRRIPYDFLVVATGLSLDYDAIEGMSRDVIGRNGIASVYAGPEAALASWQALSAFADKGGIGLFGRPETEMKCAGAPLKQTFLADDCLRRRATRDRSRIVYNAPGRALFSVPAVSERAEQLFRRQDVTVNRDHVLRRVDPVRRIATYATPAGPVEMQWDFINVIPPMRAPAVVRQSPLPWQDGPFAADGWLEVDKATLRHRRYPNVFGVGDVNGVPKGKTAASVKWQAPVAVDHLVAGIAGGESRAAYGGHTSCPLITRIGSAILVEFDYDNNLTPSFPLIDPLAEGWVPWAIKVIGLKATYTAMLRGKA